MLIGLVMGVVTSVVAGCIPGAERLTRRPDPGAAEGPVPGAVGRREPDRGGWRRWRWARASAALLMFAGAIDGGCSTAGFAMAVLALLLLSPSGALWLTRALRPVLRWLRPVEGALAADSLIQSPRRTSATVTALMLSLALVITLGGIAKASYDSIMEWTATALNPDLFVTASQSLTERNFRFAPSLGDELEKIEGIDEVQRVRSHRIVYKGTPVMIVAVEAKSMGDRARRPPVEGPPEMYRDGGGGEGRDPVGQLRRAAGPPLRRHHRTGDADRRPPGAHRRPGRGLVGSAGRHPDGPGELHPVVGRRHGERVPHLREAGRAADGRARSGSSSGLPGRSGCSCSRTGKCGRGYPR